jgi:hypothetical protein
VVQKFLSSQYIDTFLTRHSICPLVGQAIAQPLNTLFDKVVQSFFLGLVPSFVWGMVTDASGFAWKPAPF